jgi:hypothetical protein
MAYRAWLAFIVMARRRVVLRIGDRDELLSIMGKCVRNLRPAAVRITADAAYWRCFPRLGYREHLQ